jgi:hypothetical protein
VLNRVSNKLGKRWTASLDEIVDDMLQGLPHAIDLMWTVDGRLAEK